MYEQVFYEIAIILGLTTILGVIIMVLRQPLIIAFLITGALSGPSLFSLIKSHEQVELLAQIGISILLFVVGLRLDLRLIRTTGPVALATGLGQIIFTTILGFFIAYAMGFSIIGSLYISVALTFSSTIIIVKLLSDKKEIDALHGRIAVGFLIVQDIVAILAMIILTAIGGGISVQDSATIKIIGILAKGLGLLVAIGIMIRFVLPKFTKLLAFNQELLVLFAIAWAVFLSATGDYLGFSKEVGAFLGGISLASTGYRELIAARLVSIRDFLLLFFFIDLGSRIDLSIAGPQIPNAIYMSLFVLIGNPLIVMAIMGFMGYRRRTGFMAGLTVAQISEFSLILTTLGLSLGHINIEAMSLVTLVGIITICLSSYMIIYSGTLYKWLFPFLKIFERKHPYRENITTDMCQVPEVDMLIIGLGNYGSNLATHLLERKKRIAGVDFDPHALEIWRSKGIPVIFGDVGDPEFIDNLPIHCSAWIVSTIRDRDLNMTLLHLLRERRYEGKIALTATNEEESTLYSSHGAHVILKPFIDASEEAADSLTEAMDLFPKDIELPLAIKEIRLKRGSIFAGSKIKDTDLRNLTGISIVAISRAGRVYLEPNPDFQLFPGDRVVIVGEHSSIKHAEEMLMEIKDHEPAVSPKRFATAEVNVSNNSPMAGKSFAEIGFRSKYSATVIGIIRGDEYIKLPKANNVIQKGDKLLVIGKPEVVQRLKDMEL
ncbi:MAG TPA: cation:proton antiporter [Syntrophorhabdaceae bacterium]|mgnify:CR=1 FL=1|nr:cation:proton antiporter [Syntrophorhabdaceae bacterium]